MLIFQNAENNGFEPLILVKVLLIINNIVSNLMLGLHESNMSNKSQNLVRHRYAKSQFATTLHLVSS